MYRNPLPVARLIALVIAVAVAASACSSDEPNSSDTMTAEEGATAEPVLKPTRFGDARQGV